MAIPAFPREIDRRRPVFTTNGVELVLTGGEKWTFPYVLCNTIELIAELRAAIATQCILEDELWCPEIPRAACALLFMNYRVDAPEASTLIRAVPPLKLADAMTSCLFAPTLTRKDFSGIMRSILVSRGVDLESSREVLWRAVAQLPSFDELDLQPGMIPSVAP